MRMPELHNWDLLSIIEPYQLLNNILEIKTSDFTHFKYNTNNVMKKCNYF